MGRLFFLLIFPILLCSSGNANVGTKPVSIEWLNDYSLAQKKAKLENKRILVLITTSRCQWCRRLKRITLLDSKVIERINLKYVAVELNKDADKYPEYLGTSLVPTTYFLDKMGNPIVKAKGFWSAENYLYWLDDVDRKVSRFK